MLSRCRCGEAKKLSRAQLWHCGVMMNAGEGWTGGVGWLVMDSDEFW